MVNAAVRSDSKADVAEMMTIEVLGHLSLFVPKPNQCVGRCSKSLCTWCTLRFLCSVRLVLGLLTGNKERCPLQCCELSLAERGKSGTIDYLLL